MGIVEAFYLAFYILFAAVMVAAYLRSGKEKKYGKNDRHGGKDNRVTGAGAK